MLLYNKLVGSIVAWTSSNDTSPIRATLVESYCCARGSQSMAEVEPLLLGVDYALFMKHQVTFVSQNFIEGRFILYLVQLQQDYLSNWDTWRMAKTWTRGIIDKTHEDHSLPLVAL